MGKVEKKRRTRDLIAVFLRRYPRLALGATILLIVGNLFEGVSLVALFPLLGELSGDNTVAASGISRAVQSSLAVFGLDFTLRNLLFVIVMGLGLKGLLAWEARRRVGWAVARVATDLRLRLMHNLLRTQWPYFARKPAGDLANAVSGEVNAAASSFYGLLNLMSRGTHALVYGIVIALISWQAALFAVFAGMLVLMVLGRLIGKIRDIGEEQADVARSFVSKLLDTVRSLKPVRAMAAEEPFENHLAGEAELIQGAMNRQISAAEGLSSAQEPLLALVIAVGIGLATQFVEYNFATLAILGFLFWRVVTQVNRLQRSYANIAQVEPYYWSVHDIIEETGENPEEGLTGGCDVPDRHWDVVLDDVSFGFGETPVLNHLTTTFAHGSLTAVTGPSGVGKTTLTNLLIGFYRPDSGQIFVGSSDLREVSLKGWRRSIGYVPQEPVLIHDTIRVNVTLADSSIDDQAVVDALELAGAKSIVNRLDDGLDSLVGEGGSKLSAGQRQRILLARALVRQPRLLILDEATSGLDSDSEQKVIETLRRLQGKTTIVAVTHRNGIVEAADSVLELETQ